MILATAATESNIETAFKAFSIQASPVAFDILSSRLYSNTTLAIVRELLSNAYDAMAEAHTLNTKKIEVHFPDIIEPKFTIRDYGNGLSENEIFNLYTTFFQSTKRDSNEFTGCYGLGSKSPFAYCDSFMVESYQDGIAKKYLMAKIEGYPKVTKLEEKPTENANGLEVTVPVADNDRGFFNEFSWYIKYQHDLGSAIQSNVEFEVAEPEQEIAVGFSTIRLYKEGGRYNASIYIKQGMNVFKHSCNLSTCGLTVVAEVPIGTFDIVPSREHLSESEENKKKIKLVEQHITKAIMEMLSSNDPYSQFVFRSELEYDVADLLKKKYFPYKTFCSTYKYYMSSEAIRGYHCTRSMRYSSIYTGYIAGVENIKRNADDYLSLDDEQISDDVPNVIIVGKTYDERWKKVKRKLSICDAVALPHMRVKRFCYDAWTDIYHTSSFTSLPICKEALIKIAEDEVLTRITPHDAYEYLRNIVWTYNSIPELHFKISIMTISQFLKTYRNNKTKGTRSAPVNTRVGVYLFKDPFSTDISYFSNLPFKEHLKKWDILGVVLKKDMPDPSTLVPLQMLFTAGYKDIHGNKIVEQAFLNQNILPDLKKHVLVISSRAMDEALAAGLKVIDFNKLIEDVKAMDIHLYRESISLSCPIGVVNHLFDTDNAFRRQKGIKMPISLVNRIKDTSFYKMHMCLYRMISKIQTNTVGSRYHWDVLSKFFQDAPRVKMHIARNIAVNSRLMRFYSYVSANFSSYFGSTSKELYYKVADYILNNRQSL